MFKSVHSYIWLFILLLWFGLIYILFFSTYLRSFDV